MLKTGTRLGPYEIVSSLGAGGMGEVYRARDTKLHRDVAVKVLPEGLASDPDRLARFEREAQVLASLNHPHIAHIHGFEESPSTDSGQAAISALVMELVEGDTLADRLLGRGAMTIEEALIVARQLADALDAAHERGIIHRDLKPANVKVTRDGIVKVLDFGLAKAIDPGASRESPGGAASAALNSPTITSPALMSRAGVILGTAAYMSPEQARGDSVDKRTDIWAFGCVLFEMLTGSRVFDGASVTDTLAAVMRDHVPLDRLPATTPPIVAKLLARCLERDPKRRLRDIGEARIALDDAVAHPGRHAEETRAGVVRAVSQPARIAPWAIAVVAVGAAIYLATRSVPTAVRESLELEIGPPPNARFLIDSNSGNVQLSPDGARIVFRATTATGDALWIRSLARDDGKPLNGTANAQYPFWAPDSRRLGFFAEGKLKTLDTAAGLPQVIADAPNGRGGSWGDDDVIFFAPRGGGTIARVPANGGKAEEVTHLDADRGENAHYWPHILPGGRRFLYFVRSSRPENNGIYIAANDGSDATRLVSALSSGIYAPPRDEQPGYLLWVQNGDLLAQPFDAGRGVLSGAPAAIASGVRVLEAQRGLLASVSRTGALGWAIERGAVKRFTWYDRDGRQREVVPIQEGEMVQPVISPDGSRLLYTRVGGGTADVFLYDFARRAERRITPGPTYDEQPLWSPDGAEILYSSGGVSSLMRVRADGSAAPIEVLTEISQQGASAWSPDRRYIVVARDVSGAGVDVLVFPADDPKKITPLLTGPDNAFNVSFSPDGRWIAFTSDRTGRTEVYVVRFRGDQSPPALGGAPLQISSTGGVLLSGGLGWRRDGKEIVFISQDAQVMSVAVDVRGESVTAAPAAPLFRLAVNHGWVSMTPNADRFVVADLPYAAGQTIHVLTNWHDRLAQRK